MGEGSNRWDHGSDGRFDSSWGIRRASGAFDGGGSLRSALGPVGA